MPPSAMAGAETPAYARAVLPYVVLGVAVCLKLALLALALYASVRARFYAGLGASASASYLTLARGAALLEFRLPLTDVLVETWWLFPVAVLALSLGPMIFAFRAAGTLPEDDPRHAPIDRAAFAFLANVILDAALLVLVAVGLVLIARGA